ncbi:sigma-70 family RNA polymerase sigma factor [Halalkalibacter sp. APA_J-10(15)]|uniref:sigma-70 family RNA polymerase sigma factor n=1 Tax=Halalkalibacter sp. APA_J-10(15) TaxID=2933805 RepID=UPI001FF330A0|nr:sigma-70 family RNA polymerase sigma factor [Halalkalibacter sp. APA_J-10(15)]MCK0470902.1 sigma-70 family RNA polymerase sigma factor [Halalkalibacter sp. APA_J-10(15)]
MTTSRNQMISIYDKSRELKAEFNQLVDELSEGLWRYCRYLTGSPWDGEDLYQETMVKAFGSIYQRWHSTNPKSYLYRIATNTWIDHCRKEKRIIGSIEEEEVLAEETTDGLEVEEALKHLISLFTPRQSAVFLLMEVFSFTAKEVAGIVRTTPGAVYATVQRMRKKLNDQPPKINSESNSTLKSIKSEHSIIKKYLNALNSGDLEGVLSIFSDDAYNEASLGFQEFSKDEMRSGSMRFGLPGLRAEKYNLWGRNVIVVFFDGEQGAEVHDIQYQEIENGKIVYHRSYYFRKEFMFAASEELGYPVQMDKPVVDWK